MTPFVPERRQSLTNDRVDVHHKEVDEPEQERQHDQADQLVTQLNPTRPNFMLVVPRSWLSSSVAAPFAASPEGTSPAQKRLDDGANHALLACELPNDRERVQASSSRDNLRRLVASWCRAAVQS